LLSEQGWKHSTMVSRQSQGHFFSGECGLPSACGPAPHVPSRWSVGHLVATFILCLLLGLGWQPAEARRATPDTFGSETSSRAISSPAIALSDLPRAGQNVYQRIVTGGPFTYGKDGTVFGNRERQLPAQRRGFYHEYTVPTPGERDRGARRIVCGGKDARQPETCFYTQDHYQSFKLIDPSR
jgi:ribonuclease T1